MAESTTLPSLKELEELGLTAAVQTVARHTSYATPQLRQKLRTAFEHFRVVTPEVLAIFRKNLRNKTERTHRWRNIEGSRVTQTTWYDIKLTPLENYTQVPPREVLQALSDAKKLDCFDGFRVLTAERQHHMTVFPARLKDPILFGVIKGSENLYYIAQWDDDVKIEDILAEGEG